MNTLKKEPAVILFCDGSSGIYIPKRFAEEVDKQYLTGVTQEDLDGLADPEDTYYWDNWEYVYNNALFTFEGDEYYLYQSDDLWLLCFDRMTDEEKRNFGFDVE